MLWCSVMIQWNSDVVVQCDDTVEQWRCCDAVVQCVDTVEQWCCGHVVVQCDDTVEQ